MTYYVVTKKHWPPKWFGIDRSGLWPRVTFAFWTIDLMPDAIFVRVLDVIAELRRKKP
jgi:hypothetical protein